MEGMPTEQIAAMVGEPVYNSAYGGGTLNETIDTFWNATTLTTLKRVWIGLNFNQYSDYARTYRTDAYRSVHQNPLLYFTNRTVVNAGLYMIYYGLRGRDPNIGKVLLDRDAFWREVLGPVTDGYYSRQVEPVIYRQELLRIVEHCRTHGIMLRFVIFPSHVELQHRISDYKLQDRYIQFKQEMSAMAETYDFDIENSFTSERSNFADPMHLTPPAKLLLAREIWGGALEHGRKLP